MRNHRFTGGRLHLFNYVFLNFPANRHPELGACQAPRVGCDKGVMFTKAHEQTNVFTKELEYAKKVAPPREPPF